MLSIPVTDCALCPFFRRESQTCWAPAKVLNGPDPVPASVKQARNPDGTLREVDNPRGPPPTWCPMRCSPAVVFLVPAEGR